MSNNEQMIHETDGRSPIDAYFEDAGVHPVQSLALTSLAAHSVPLSALEVERMINAAQGEEPGWLLPNSATTDFFTDNLVPGGYVESFASRLATRNQPTTKYFITELGMEWGLPSAGATMGWQLRHPDVPLSLLLGKKRRQQTPRVGERGAVLRLGLYRDILDRPDGAAYDELTTDTRSYSDVFRLAKILGNEGVLEIVRKPPFRDRTFGLTPPDDTRYLNVRPEYTSGTKAMRMAMQHLCNQELTHFTGADVLNAFYSIMPHAEVPPKAIINAFFESRNSGLLPFVHGEEFASNRRLGTRANINPDFVQPIEDLVQVHHLLRTEQTYRDEARAAAYETLKDKERVATLMRIAHESSTEIHKQSQEEWQELILRHIPLGGIAIDALYKLVSANMPRRVEQLTFRKRLSALRPYVDIAEAERGRGGNPGFVRLAYEPSEYRSDWQNHAACKDMNPAIFTEAETYKQVAHAKSVCRDCPVRGDCLGYALDQGLKFAGVWGGTSQYERKNLPRAVSAKIKALTRQVAK